MNLLPDHLLIKACFNSFNRIVKQGQYCQMGQKVKIVGPAPSFGELGATLAGINKLHIFNRKSEFKNQGFDRHLKEEILGQQNLDKCLLLCVL